MIDQSEWLLIEKLAISCIIFNEEATLLYGIHTNKVDAISHEYGSVTCCSF